MANARIFVTDNKEDREVYSYASGGEIESAITSALENLNKNGIVIKDNNGSVTVITYNTGGHSRELPAMTLHNLHLINGVVSEKNSKSASEIIDKIMMSDFENFKESSIKKYLKLKPIYIFNQNELVYSTESFLN